MLLVVPYGALGCGPIARQNPAGSVWLAQRNLSHSAARNAALWRHVACGRSACYAADFAKAIARAGRRPDREENYVTGTLDWKWIGIGVVVMIVLNLVAVLILGFVLGPQLEGVASPEEVEFSGGQVVLATVLNFLAFAIGGFIVGLKSSGRTILEPGVSAAIAVVIALLISGNFGIVNLIAGGIVPFLAGVLGGWLGEKRRHRLASTLCGPLSMRDLQAPNAARLDKVARPGSGISRGSGRGGPDR